MAGNKPEKSAQEKKAERAKKRVLNFIKIGNKRVNKVINSLELVGALSNRRSYTYDAAQVEKIFKALQSAMDSAKNKFEASADGKAAAGFEL